MLLVGIDDTEVSGARSSTPLAVRVLVLVSLVLHLSTALLSPLRSGDLLETDRTTPQLNVPAGGYLTDAEGHGLRVLEREAGIISDHITVEHFDPGAYTVEWPGSGIGGAHFPARATLVAVGTVVDVVGATSPLQAAVPWLAAGVLALLAGLAGSSARAHRYRLLLAAGTGLWASTGWSALSLAAGVATVCALVALALLLRGAQGRRGGIATAAIMGVLLWPSVLFGVVCSLVTIFVSSAPARQRKITRSGAVLAGLLGTLLAVAAVTELSPRLSTPSPAPGVTDCLDRYLEDLETGRDCFRFVGAVAGANQPAANASQALLAELAKIEGPLAVNAVCRQTGLAMSTAAARWGQLRDDPRQLVTALQPICDYSSIHGIPAGALAESADNDFDRKAVELCNSTSADTSYLSDAEYQKQCWQGVGVAVMRRFGMRDRRVFDLCQQAEGFSRGNCVDGYVQEYIDQLARVLADPGRRMYPEGYKLSELCRELEGQVTFDCYRYIGEEAFYRGQTREQGADNLQELCRREQRTDSVYACWNAFGMVTVRTKNYDPNPGNRTDVELWKLLDRTCTPLPAGDPSTGCWEGGMNALIGIRNADVDLDALCAPIPADIRERLCALAQAYVAHIKPADASQ